MATKAFKMIENYLYMSHLDSFVILPTYPEQINDAMSATFTSTQPLSRSAPIYAYSYSGPRSITFTLVLHRELMTQINTNVSNLDIKKLDIGDDYVDTIIKQLQAIAVPKYVSASKMVNPPTVSVRFGNEVYIHGIVDGGVAVTYSLPLLDNNKYAQVSISFTVSEIDPYSAETIAQQGSFRGLNKSLERRIYKK